MINTDRPFRCPQGINRSNLFVAFMVCAALALALAGCATVNAGSSRVYRIGWELDPPFQTEGANGVPSGFVVELVREAARRRGIRVQWVRVTEGSEIF